jgi:hypothetical protein
MKKLTLTGQTLNQLYKSVVEKDVENSYRQFLSTRISDMIFTSPYLCDGFGVSEKYKIRILCEFKKDSDFRKKRDRVEALCQVVAYVKKFTIDGIKIPNVILIGDRNEWFVLHVNEIFKYLSLDIDWKIAPSDAHTNSTLFNVLMEDDKINPFVFDVTEIDSVVDKIKDLAKNVVRLIPITPKNITDVFNYFEKNVLKKNKLTTNELANLFVQILINPDDNFLNKRKKVIHTKAFSEVPIKSNEDFKSFFKHFQYEYSPKQKEELTATVDRLVEDVTRRKQGEFFTQTIWVDRAHKYMCKVFGQDWKDKYVVWDPAWGTGNLTRDYNFKELYASTLIYSDIQTAQQMDYNSESVKFQFDFLNDDYDFLPTNLKKAIEEGKEIIIFMNSPYQDGSELSTNNGESNIKGNINTTINKIMKKNGIGKCSKQLYAQFLYRVLLLNKLNNISIACFAPPLYLTGESYKEFRNKFFEKFEFKDGFMLNSSNFSDTSDNWPISFSIWKNGKQGDNFFKFDVFDKNNEETFKTGEKVINLISDEKRLVKKIKESLIKDGVFMGTCTFQGNTIQGNNQFVTLLNGGKKLKGKGTFEIYSKNFCEISTFFGVRILFSGSNAKWIDYYDDYKSPEKNNELYKKFEKDSILISLFNNKSNQIGGNGIKNEFFWMSKKEIMELANDNNCSKIYSGAKTDNDRYVHNLLFGEENIYEQLSPDSKLVLDKATELVRKSMTMRSHFTNDNNHLNSWDAGYAQLKQLWKTHFPKEFKEFRELYKKFEDRMRPLVYELGFLLK